MYRLEWIAVCDECGHRWLTEGEKEPERCPSRKCFKRTWNKSGGKREVEVVPIDPLGNEGRKRVAEHAMKNQGQPSFRSFPKSNGSFI
jgi:hypothetical protein